MLLLTNKWIPDDAIGKDEKSAMIRGFDMDGNYDGLLLNTIKAIKNNEFLQSPSLRGLSLQNLTGDISYTP